MTLRYIALLIVCLAAMGSPVYASWWNDDYFNCANWSITEADGIDRVYMPLIFNATGLVGKNANSSDFRIVNAPCGGGGSAIEYEILSNTSESVYFVTILNLTKNKENIYSFYYNYSGSGVGENINLFVYANNGTRDDFSDNGATHTISEGAINLSVGGTHNKYIYRNIVPNLSIGKVWFSTDAKIFVGAGEHNAGVGENTTTGYSDYVLRVFASSSNWYVSDNTVGDTIITPEKDGQWYNLQYNMTLPATHAKGTNISINGTWYGDFGAYGGNHDAIQVIRFSGHANTFGLYKNIFLSQNQFTSYLKAVVSVMGGFTQYTPPPTYCAISFIEPSPDNNATKGFDYNAVIKLLTGGTTGALYRLEWDGTNHTLGTGYNYTPTLTGGKVYSYIAYCNITDKFATGTNQTERRTLLITSSTEKELAERLDWLDMPNILLLVLIGILGYVLIRI